MLICILGFWQWNPNGISISKENLYANQSDAKCDRTFSSH